MIDTAPRGTAPGPGGRRLPSWWHRLSASGHRRRFPRGSLPILEGESGDLVLGVETGLLKISKTGPDGDEFVIALAYPGDLVGEMAALDGSRRQATVSVLRDATVWTLPGERFLDEVSADPALSRAVTAMLLERCRSNTDRLTRIATMDALGLVCDLVTERLEAERGGPVTAGPVTVDLDLTQDEQAGYLGLSRRAVNKAYGELRRLGWVRYRAGTAIVVDPAAVARRAGRVVSSFDGAGRDGAG